MKRCKDCHEDKPFDGFSKDSKRRDGLHYICKACAKARAAKWYKANFERARAQSKQWHADNAAKANASGIAWQKRNPDRSRLTRQASIAVRQAIRDGELVRGTQCESCGKEVFCEASHHDYARPLDVRWLCRSCHRVEDMQNPKTLETT